MVKEGYKAITVKRSTFDRLKEVKASNELKSIPAAIEFIIDSLLNQ